MSKYIVIALLFFLPFVVFPQAIPSSFETPKIILAEVGIWLLLIICLFGKDKFKTKKSNLPNLLILFGVICLTIIQVMLAPSSVSLFGNIFRLQGIFLLWQLIAFSLLSSRISLEKISNKIYLLSLALLFLGIIIFRSEVGRLSGTLGEPNALAATAVFIWPFCFFSSKKMFKFLSLVVTALIIFLSGSRSGILALIFQIIFLLLATKFKIRTQFAIIVTTLLLLASFSLPFTESISFPENRAEIWKVALAGGKERPLLGSGFGNVEKIIYETAIKIESNVQYQVVDSSHNIFLDWWIQGGVVGLILFVSLICLSFKNFILRDKKLEICLLIGLLTALSFNPASIVSLVAFWWTIGQGYSRSPGAEKER